MELSKSGVWIRHCIEDAAKAATRAVGGTNQLFCAGVAVLLFLSGVHFVHAAGKRSAPDALFFPDERVLRVPFVTGVSGGSHFDSCGVPDFVAGFDSAGCQLLKTSSRPAIRGSGSGIDAADLPRAVFLRIFFPRVHGMDGDDWHDPDAFCGDANDGKDSLG